MAIPVHCEPCPGKTNTVLPRTSARPVGTDAGGVPAARARRPATSSSRSPPTTTARWAKGERPVARVRATPAGERPGFSSRYVARRSAWAVSASGVFADRGQATAVPADAPSSGTRSSGVRGWASWGACSMTTCTLVPLMPKEDTAERRGRPVSGQLTGSVSSRTCPADQSTCRVGSSTCRVFGRIPCRVAITILMTAAAPAAACGWPMLDLTEPSHSGRSSVRPCPYVAMSACASMGSPSVVPVPCASTASTSAVSSPASARASRITRCCAGPLGAEMPLLAPSWLTAEPRTTASTGWPLRTASESRSSRSRPTPSDQLVPSAASANDLARPSGARPRWRLKSTNISGVPITAAPPARARSLSPLRSDWQARCSATRDDEHAVSTV